MKVITLLFLFTLTSCWMTDEQLYNKNQECLKMWMRAERSLFDWYCTTKWVVIIK